MAKEPADLRASLLKKPVIINIGLDLFFQALKDQKAEAVNVNWRPASVDIDPEIKSILDQIL